MAPDFTTSAKPRKRLSLAGMVLTSHDAQEQGADVGTNTLLLCLSSDQDPSPWDVATHIQGGSSHLS